MVSIVVVVVVVVMVVFVDELSAIFLRSVKFDPLCRCFRTGRVFLRAGLLGLCKFKIQNFG